MGGQVSRNEFDWTYTDEPHATRRRLIVAKHPEIKQLFGIDHHLKYVVSAVVITQIIACILLRDSDWTLVFLESYIFGGLVNHALTLAIHDISHNTIYGNLHPLKNRLFGIWANIPLAVPMSVSFKKYHVEHHRYLGVEVLDTDVPTELEGKLFTTMFRKCIWLLLQPLFYAFRPMIIYRKNITDLEVLNFVIQISFDLLILYFCGIKSLTYLLFGTLISLGWHPTAGHFIAEHYIYKAGQETASYYGPFNHVLFNVGYHMEHHDFPFIPSDKLPLVRQIAPEFYNDLYHHTSYISVLYQFLTDPALGPYARMKRKARVAQKYYGQNMLTEYREALLHYAGFYQFMDFVTRVKALIVRSSKKFPVSTSASTASAFVNVGATTTDSHLKTG